MTLSHNSDIIYYEWCSGELEELQATYGEAVQEAIWMKEFITELGVVPSVLDPMVIYCDNNGAIANAKEPRSHKNSKHIKHWFHSIREAGSNLDERVHYGTGCGSQCVGPDGDLL